MLRARAIVKVINMDIDKTIVQVWFSPTFVELLVVKAVVVNVV